MEWVQTKESEFRDIHNEVKKIPLIKLMTRYSETPLSPKPTGENNYMALCPYHGERKRSLKVTPRGCRCFSCGFSQSTIGAITPLLQTKYGHAFTKEQTVLQIACDEGIIDKKTFERLSGVQYEFKEGHSFKETTREITVKPDDELEFQTKVYERICRLYGLSKAHETHLRMVRHIDNVNDYFSITTDKTNDVLNALITEFTAEKLFTIPGFFKKCNSNGRWVFKMLQTQGLGILIRDARGYVKAIQVRSDEKNTDKKYTFLSCSLKRDDFIGSGSVGTPVNVIYPKSITPETTIAIVEGHFKAKCLADQGYIALSVQGVYNFLEAPMEIYSIEQQLQRHFNNIEIFYDADMFDKMAVFGALVRLSAYFSNKRPDLKQIVAIWDKDLGKGIDDLIFAGYKATKRTLSMEYLLEENTACYKSAAKLMGVEEENLIYLSTEERKKFESIWSKLMRGKFFSENSTLEETSSEYDVFA